MTKQKNITVKQLKEKVRKQTWKYFWQQKLFELGIIPLGGLTIWYLPYWVGLLIINIFGYQNVINFYNFIINGTIINFERFDYWNIGLLVLCFIGLFIFANIVLARHRAVNKLPIREQNMWDYRNILQ